MAALEGANRIRSARAADKQLIRARQLDARRILAGPPCHWARAQVAELLLALPGVGHTKVRRMLAACQVSPSRTVAGLTRPQALRLISVIRRYAEPQMPFSPAAKRFAHHDPAVLPGPGRLTVACSRCQAQAQAPAGAQPPLLLAALEALDGQDCAMAAIAADGSPVAAR